MLRTRSGSGNSHLASCRRLRNRFPVEATQVLHATLNVERAGLDSDKLIDLFKVKARDKGKPEAEGPLAAYRTLVVTQRRQGLYSMPCAAEPSLAPA